MLSSPFVDWISTFSQYTALHTMTRFIPRALAAIIPSAIVPIGRSLVPTPWIAPLETNTA
ncbi:MAG TPA: hypothetical protein VHC69_23865 [Polyangiaceae bacterium]|nr:hypothetical protein [Polyangiaceae bacterium]